MPQDLAIGTALSVSGLVLYGLYYDWRRKRMDLLRKEESRSKKISHLEKTMLHVLLQNDSKFYEELLDKLKIFLIKQYGFDLSQNIPAMQYQDSEKSLDIFQRKYLGSIQNLQKFFREYQEKISRQQNIDPTAFFSDWFLLFPDTSSDTNQANQHDHDFSNDIKQTCSENFKRIVGLADIKSEFRNYADVESKLKEYHCINKRDFVGSGKEIQTIYDQLA